MGTITKNSETAAAALAQDMFQVRLVTLDYYLSHPAPELSDLYKGCASAKVPILRIYGPTSTGEKACVHIHGVFPYIYVPYEGGENPDRDALLLALALDKALQKSAGVKGDLRFVHKVALVSGIPLYGYHSKNHQFFKIYFFNPYCIKKASDLLLSGAILNMKLQPHESHVPYTLQFMIDYNLFGMSMINFRKIFYREGSQFVASANGDEDRLLSKYASKISRSRIEVDAFAEDVLNKNEKGDLSSNPGLAAIWQEERARRRRAGILSDITILTSQSRVLKEPFGVEVSFLNELGLKIQDDRSSERNEPFAAIVSSPLNETSCPYAAEVPEENQMAFLNASYVDDINQIPAFEPSPQDVTLVGEASLINETLLSQVPDREDGEQRGDEVEGENEEEDEEELDLPKEEELCDMTQPLSPPPGWKSLRRAALHSESSDSEEDFFEEMARDLLQMDGAADSATSCDDDFSDEFPSWTWDDSFMSFINDDNLGTLDPCDSDDNQWLLNSDDNCLAPFLLDSTTYSSGNSFIKESDDNSNLLSKCQQPVEGDQNFKNCSSNQNNNNSTINNNNNDNNNDNNNLSENMKIDDKSKNLTLREYFSSMGDIQTIDLKTIADKEMVIIEYKPLNSSKSMRNQFYIKPLNNFLEDWNAAEKALTCNDFKQIAEQQISSLPHSHSEAATTKNYYANENLISKDTSKIKLASEKAIQLKKVIKKTTNEGDGQKENLPAAKHAAASNYAKDEEVKILNEQFERYYQSVKNVQPRMAKKSLTNPKLIFHPRKNFGLCSKKRASTSTLDPVQFLSNVLKVYSTLPRTSNLPPLSITMNIGNGTPIQVNVQPASTLQNFDGPLSSSDDDGSKANNTRRRKIRHTTSTSAVKRQRSDEKSESVVGTSYFRTKRKKLQEKEARRLRLEGELLNKGNVKESDIIASSESDNECLEVFRTQLKSTSKSQVNAISLSSTDEFSDASQSSENDRPCQDILNTAFDADLNSQSEAVNAALSLDGGSLRLLRPNKLPPSKTDVVNTLRDYNIFASTVKGPFYSRFSDVSKALEVGNKSLKIDAPFTPYLKPFTSALNIEGLEERRLHLLPDKTLLSRSELVAHDKEIILTPLQKPPTYKDLIGWLPKMLKNSTEGEVEAPAKLILPLSSREGSDASDADETLSLSPITPRSSSNASSGRSKRGSIEVPASSGSSQTGIVATSSKVQAAAEELPPVDFVLESPEWKSTPIVRQRSTSPSSMTRKLLKGSMVRRLSQLQSVRERRDSNESTPLFESDESCDKKVCSPSPEAAKKIRKKDLSCILEGITLENTYGFKNSAQNFQNVKSDTNDNNLTLLAIEVLAETRGDLLSNPEFDAVAAVFYAIQGDSFAEKMKTGIVTVGSVLNGSAVNYEITTVNDEAELFAYLIKCMHEWDPDIILGYEIELGSWGYLTQRAFILGINLLNEIGRTIHGNSNMPRIEDENTSDLPRFILNLRVSGRIVLNVWRLLRHEIALTSYNFESVSYHLLHERHARFSSRTLSHLWKFPVPRARYIPAQYLLTRLHGSLRILAQLDIIARTSELARLFGIQFAEVLSRGSQFRVESMMLRLAKPQGFVAVSPSVGQRAEMRAPTSLPLIMEPESQFYSDPVIVLDFQSLYPSMIIAYNYCFSTCLGRVAALGGNDPFEFGCTRLRIPKGTLDELRDNIHVSPAGVAFVKATTRKGVLPVMLQEILTTRLMVKKAMKEAKGNKTLEKLLHARQLGLKLIANVTYGYTAANFSGRMPCIEVGDSVVSKGRETLQRAIRMVNTTEKWNARVVYGDTDSLFVLTPGKTKEEAFRIGEEIADAVTLDNPRPVKLKLEKVYQPCILQTKKRYVGYMYESPKQEKPTYDAKGIETVRRDGCPAIGKVLQKALQILFETSDVSMVKKYILRQFEKLLFGRVNIQDLIFAKEYRGRRGYKPGACVPALQLSKEWTRLDPRREPRKKERVPYVVVYGAPGIPLIRLVRSPTTLIEDPSVRIHALYYITKALIPPLQRCFGLLGADVTAWFASMPRRFYRQIRGGVHMSPKKRSTISQYFSAAECVICKKITAKPICESCSTNHQQVSVSLMDKIHQLESSYHSVIALCQSCCGRADHIDCISLDCPVLFRKKQLYYDTEQITTIRQLLN